MAGNPTIEGLRFPLGLPGIRIAAKNLGVQKWVPDELTLNGRSLDHSDLRLVFRHLRLGFTYIAKPATAKSPGSLAVRVPHDLTVYRDQPSQSLDAIEVAANEVKATDPTSWPPGVYTVSAARAVKTKQVFDRLFTTSPVAFGMVPDIDTSSAPFAIAAGPPAALSIKLAAPVRVSPTGEVLQQVRTFAGGLELNGRATSGDGLTLNWEAADSVKLKSELKAATDRGELLLLRVQVDGVDSSMLKPPVGDALAPPREFDPALIVTVP